MIQADKNDLLRARICICCLPPLVLDFYFTYLFIRDYFFMLLQICLVLTAFGLLFRQDLA